MLCFRASFFKIPLMILKIFPMQLMSGLLAGIEISFAPNFRHAAQAIQVFWPGSPS